MADEKVFSVQPRFKIGDYPSGWALIDGIFRMGDDLPEYGTEFRDMYLSMAWINEPMTAGVFNTWVEKAQTVNWKVTGGKNNANYYAKLLHNADNNQGWTYHEGVCALDYLVCDKGCLEELGRTSLKPKVMEELRTFLRDFKNLSEGDRDLRQLNRIINRATTGKVSSLNHIDATRMIKIGLPGMRWRYFPDYREPISIPDMNLVQMMSMPSGRDRYRGYGHCALSRLIDAKNLMLGYLKYFRQEVGDLPPELITIVNGMSQTAFEDALKKYKMDKTARNLDEYGKIFWLGSDDPMTPVDIKTISLVSSNKNFDYRSFVEWWAKLLALNTGESVGEYWLIQHSGATKALESIQALKARGKGVAKYLQEKERRYNFKVMPFGVKFEYDNKDDSQDAQREEILAKKIANLKTISSIGVDRQEPAYTIEEIQELARHWEIVPPEMTDEEIPTVLGAMLKSMNANEEQVTVTRYGETYKHKPLVLLNSDRDNDAAKYVYNVLHDVYSNGTVKHKQLEEVIL